MSPDPYGQYWSPYMSMGNSWANMFDPDGGFSSRSEARQFRRDNDMKWWNTSISKTLAGEFTLNSGDVSWYHGNEIVYSDGIMGGAIDIGQVEVYGNYVLSEFTKDEWHVADKVSNWINNQNALVRIPGNTLYNIADNVHIWATKDHLDGQPAAYSERIDAGINTMLTAVPYSKALKLPKLNAAQFNKAFKGTFITKTAPKLRGKINKGYNNLNCLSASLM